MTGNLVIRKEKMTLNELTKKRYDNIVAVLDSWSVVNGEWYVVFLEMVP